MEDLKKKVDEFTTQLERALKAVSAAIEEKTGTVSDISKHKLLLGESSLAEGEINKLFEQEAKEKEEFVKLAERAHKFQNKRIIDFVPVNNFFPNTDYYDIFIFLRMFPDINSDLQEEAAALKGSLPDEDLKYVQALEGTDYIVDERLISILDTLMPKKKEISELLDKFTLAVRSKCTKDCSSQSIPIILTMSNGGTKGHKKSKRRTRRRVK